MRGNLILATALFVSMFAPAVNAEEIEQVIPQGDNIVLQNVIVCTHLPSAVLLADMYDKYGKKGAQEVLEMDGVPCYVYREFAFVAGKLEYQSKRAIIVETTILIGCAPVANTTPQMYEPEFTPLSAQLFVFIPEFPYRAGVTEHPIDPCEEESF